MDKIPSLADTKAAFDEMTLLNVHPQTTLVIYICTYIYI